MLRTIRAVLNNGKIQVLESIDMLDGTDVLVTILPNADRFWLKGSEPSLQAVWDDPEYDIYAELLSTSGDFQVEHYEQSNPI